MIDLRVLRDNPDAVRTSQIARGEDASLVDDVRAADEQRRSALTAYEQLRAEQNAASKEIGRAQGDERQALLARTKELAAQVKDAKAAADAAEDELNRLAMSIPNVVIDGVPAGGEDDYAVREIVGTPRDFAAEGFEPRDHMAIAEGLDAIDTARGAKVSGARFYFLKGVGARLEMALLGLAMQKAIAAGFVPLITPTLVRPDVIKGAGFIDHHAEEVYYLPADDLYLTGTSEVALAGYHADEILLPA